MLKCALLGLVALLAFSGSALALTPAQVAVLLTPPPPPAAIDFTKNSYAEKGAHYASFTAMPGVSFSRASIKYAQKVDGTLVQFASGQPAITDQGLSAEPAATNLLLHSQGSFNSYTLSNVSVVDNNATAPDGTATASTVTDNSTSSNHSLYGTNFSVTAGQTYTACEFLKGGTARYVSLRGETYSASNYPWITLDTTTGSVNANAGVTSSSATQFANAWWRACLTWTGNTTSGVGNIVVAGSNVSAAPASNSTLGNSYAGSSSTFLVWQGDVTNTSSPSSPIVTTTASATRAADTCSFTYSPNGSRANVTYTGGSGVISPTSPINLCASSGGAWVGKYLKTVVVKR